MMDQIRRRLISNECITLGDPGDPGSFPHAVKITLLVYLTQRPEIADWLISHMGEHDKLWCWVKHLEIRFRYESDATQFTLTWC